MEQDIFTNFMHVPYACYWLRANGTFEYNDAAAESNLILNARIQNLLAPILNAPELLTEQRGMLFSDIMRVYGLAVLPLNNGVLAAAVGSKTPPAHYLSSGVRGSVTNIFAVLPLLAKRVEDPDRKYLDEIQHNCYELLRLSCNLESLTTLRTQRHSMATFDLAALVRSVCTGAETVCAHGGVHIEANAPAVPVPVDGDARLLGEALLNMIRNALQYTRDGNIVTVTLKTLGKNAVLTVEDRGLGIKEENLPHIFELFYSADPYSDTPERPGPGLGLTVTRDLVSSLGGTLTAESRFGEYTRIHMSLPLAETVGEVFVSDAADYLLNRYSPVYVQLAGFCRMLGE